MKKKFYGLLMAFILSLGSIDYALARDMIEIYVPTPPGGAVDMTARALSKALTNNGYSNVVIYQPGANGDIALNKTLEKSGTSIFVGSSANFVFSHLVVSRENIHARELHLIGPSVSNAMAFYAPNNKSVKTFKDLITLAKQNELPCATSNSHGEVELRQINQQYGTKFTAVPYKGTGQLIPDLVGGHVLCAFDQIAPYAQLQDKVNFLATSGTKMFNPTTPLISNTLPGYRFATWYAFGISKNSPLLNDKKFIEAARKWNQNKELTDPLTERSFVIELDDENLNIRAIRETLYYRNLVK